MYQARRYCCSSNVTAHIFRIDKVLPPLGSTLAQFLIPRTPDSPNHVKIQEQVKSHFRALHWHVETDAFEQETVLGRSVKFTNIIATSNPQAQRRIILAAHYDSKMHVDDAKPGQEFIGATDAAWSCALMLELASSLSSMVKSNDIALQMVFFDGEEALVHWSAHDSIYGARHLAWSWSQPSSSASNHLQNIEVLILLDLLGAADARIYSYFPNTSEYFGLLAEAERLLRKGGKLKGRSPMFYTDRYYVAKQAGRYMIEDDHVPFSDLGVPVLHLIPLSFPHVWHSIKDDVTALDPDTCHDLALVIFEFIKSLFSQ